MLKKKRSKRLLKAGVATTCFLSLSMTTFATPQAYGMKPKETVDIVKSSLNIYPVPQKIEHKSAGFTLKNEVNIVIHGEQEEATMPRLEKTLREHNISYVINDVVVNDKANIVITSNKDHCDDCLDGVTTDLETLNKREGYLLNISDDVNENGIITITASDKDGAYYGVITLDQILDQAKDNKIAEVLVADYPEIKNRGFIEGFYGVPWSHEDRMSLMADTSEYKMNTYIYAPKDDPYHRAQWKELYPEDKAQEIAELAKAGKDNNLNFCWTIHPGATLKFTEEDYQAIIRKFEQLYDLGVRQFGVLFDDTDDWTNGGKQADWINRINEEFVKAKGDVENMIVISARYNSAWGPNMNTYFKPFMQKLQNTDIEVMWTGHATMSNVSKSVFEWPKTATGVNKDVAVWWNYPVNDYCDGKLLMAPMHNLNPDLDNVTGFYSNPMNQAEASKVALYSIADYTWNTDSFDYMQSWETAIEKLVPEASSEFKRFAANISYLSDDGGASGPFIFDESVYLADKIEAFNLAIQNKESLVQSATALLEEFETIKSDVASIRTKVDNANLQKEIEPFLGSYEALSHAGIGAMKAVIAAEKGDIKEWMLQT
ncbi:beta-N-acetylglucosaminidase domain-containing protein, partial [Clostridium sp.]|uniref:beta-N-acetylglucosaminidase domain-containing protein n=1 Tax=Clostridium sp. TaxID=1506 RepID=UPI003F334363